jgi:L-aminopeptidase/D-esterase-like protein
MVLCLEEYQPQVLDALSEAFRATITASEAAIMRSIRHAKQVKENDKRDAAGMNAMTRAEKASAGLVRAGYRTSPEQLRKVYEFALKNLVE